MSHRAFPANVRSLRHGSLQRMAASGMSTRRNDRQELAGSSHCAPQPNRRSKFGPVRQRQLCGPMVELALPAQERAFSWCAEIRRYRTSAPK